MDNVTSLFDKPDKKAEPNYKYQVTLRDKTTVTGEGYLVIGHGFYAIAYGEGVLRNVWPAELIQSVENLGEITTSTLN